MSRTTKWIVAGVIAIALVLVFVKRTSRESSTEKVAIEKATKRTIIETVSTNGKIFPATEIRVSPVFSGEITDLKVAEGDTVKKGQVVAYINNSTPIKSSIDGIVLTLKVKKGEIVTGNSFSVGSDIMTIADMTNLEIRAEVGENDIIKVTTGDSADIIVDAYNNRRFRGVVKSIANNTRPTSPGFNTGDITNYEVRIKLDTASYGDLKSKAFPFRPGMNTSVEIRTRKMESVLAVPIGAVNARVKDSEKNMDDKRKEEQSKIEDDETVPESNEQLDEVVFVLQKDNTVKKVVVQSGIQDINYIEIKSGLNEGDQVVIGPYSALSKNLRTGMKVKVVEKNKLFEN